MDDKIIALNRMAAIHHRADGNPASTLPSSAISNCFPGLEYDFKNFWKRVFAGIEFLEWDNYVVSADDSKLEGLIHHRLMKVDGRPIVVPVTGPSIPGGESSALATGALNGGFTPGVVTIEWSNALAFISKNHGQKVTCHFTREKTNENLLVPTNPEDLLEVELTIRQIFEGNSAVPDVNYLQPGELTQTLCSPWQHDYRECSCYYWPASRPDYVNVVPTSDGISTGDNWLSKERSGQYILDDRKDTRLVTYQELFMSWEKQLQFQIRGQDLIQKNIQNENF